MCCFSVECLKCYIGILQVFLPCVANALDYFKYSLEPIAIHYEWVTRNIQTPGIQTSFMLARVTITAENGDCIYDKFIKPESRVIDYRTYLTGITEDILKSGDDINSVQSDVQEIISNKIIVGHCLHRLLRCLSLEHPIWDKRDIVLYKGFPHYLITDIKQHKTIESLKTLARILLNIDIKNGISSSVESAQAAMKIYLNFKENWDEYMLSKQISLNCPLAIDCEMVAKAGRPGNNDMLARVSLVDINGTCIYDKYVLPTHKIVDYRTHITGIDETKLVNAVPLGLVKREVEYITKGRVLVGHDLYKDLCLLDLNPPDVLKRDTSLFIRFRMYNAGRPKLRDLAKHFLGITIQNRAHCSVEDAAACMELYRFYKEKWDREIYENELNYIDKNDFTSSNPVYKSITVAIVCSLREGKTKAERLYRVTIVDSNLICVYDKFVSNSDRDTGEPYNRVRHEVDLLLRSKIVVGFNLRVTFAVLSTTVSFINRRDALLFDKFHSSVENVTLKGIFKHFLPMAETATKNSVDAAKKLMALYLKYKQEWDKFVEEKYMKQFEATYNATLERPVAISNLVLKISNMTLIGRVSIVDTNDSCLYDKFIGGTNLSNGTHLDIGAYNELKSGVRNEINKIINSRVVIGYNLNYLFKSLGILKSWWFLRDVMYFSKFPRFYLTKLPLTEILKRSINLKLTNVFDTVQIAKALMQVYKQFKNEWDEEIKRKRITNMLNEMT